MEILFVFLIWENENIFISISLHFYEQYFHFHRNYKLKNVFCIFISLLKKLYFGQGLFVQLRNSSHFFCNKAYFNTCHANLLDNKFDCDSDTLLVLALLQFVQG